MTPESLIELFNEYLELSNYSFDETERALLMEQFQNYPPEEDTFDEELYKR